MRKGFTLIELLVVIAIIAILAGFVIFRVSSAINDAKITRTRSDLKSIANAMNIAKAKTGKSLREITGSWSTREFNNCENRDLRNVPNTDQCMVATNNAFKSIENLSGIGIQSLARDPWGSPYILDENEGEAFGSPAIYCYRDIVESVGSSGVWTSFIEGSIRDPISSGPDYMGVRIENITSQCYNTVLDHDINMN